MVTEFELRLEPVSFGGLNRLGRWLFYPPRNTAVDCGLIGKEAGPCSERFHLPHTRLNTCVTKIKQKINNT